MTDEKIKIKAFEKYPINDVDVNSELRERYIKKLKRFYSTKKIKG
jgi:hypothetical protein